MCGVTPHSLHRDSLTLIDCVNISKTSEAANLMFQWIFVLNSLKHKFFDLLNQTKATNFTTHGGDISLLHTRYRVSDSSHSVLGKDGCYIVPEPYLIYTILRYQKEVNKPLSKKVSEVAIGALLQKKLFVKIS